jgi:hypothetical protein
MVIWSRSAGVVDVVDKPLDAGFCVLDVVICGCPAGGVTGRSMFVVRVVVPGSRRESWTVLGGTGCRWSRWSGTWPT